MSASATARELLSQFDTKRANELVREALNAAGIVVGGSAPWDITVHDDRFYQRLLRDGTLGFGESYMEGWWDAPQLDQASRVGPLRSHDALPGQRG